MKHRIKGKKLNRNSGSRRALLKGLVKSVLKHGKIETTLVKAKYSRPEVEKIVTLSKDNSLHNRRLLIKKLGDKVLVSKLLDVIGPMFEKRNGGYTRIIRTSLRKGDMAQMAELSLLKNNENNTRD